MKKDIGKTIQQIRLNKGLKLKELHNTGISTSQISNIEKGLQMPSADKLITLLGVLNVKYDEFIYLMDDGYLSEKQKMESRLSEFVKRKNINGLKKLAQEAKKNWIDTNDIYFQHVNIIALAMTQLISSNNDFKQSKEYLQPIKDYLSTIENWGYYEISLISQCLFMFEIEDAILYGEQALKFIEKNYSFYKAESVGCVLLTNMAVYCLDYQEYYHLSLKYSQTSINLAALNNDATRTLNAKIIYQVSCFKLENGLFNKKHLLSLIKIFKVIEWHKEYQLILDFIKKHGLELM